MNAELPPFKNGEQNSESASTLDRSLTPSRFLGYIAMKDKIWAAESAILREARVLTI